MIKLNIPDPDPGSDPHLNSEPEFDPDDGNFVDEVALEFPENSARANFQSASRYYALKHPYP